jgi:hypothetical protein
VRGDLSFSAPSSVFLQSQRLHLISVLKLLFKFEVLTLALSNQDRGKLPFKMWDFDRRGTLNSWKAHKLVLFVIFPKRLYHIIPDALIFNQSRHCTVVAVLKLLFELNRAWGLTRRRLRQTLNVKSLMRINILLDARQILLQLFSVDCRFKFFKVLSGSINWCLSWLFSETYLTNQIFVVPLSLMILICLVWYCLRIEKIAWRVH